LGSVCERVVSCAHVLVDAVVHSHDVSFEISWRVVEKVIHLGGGFVSWIRASTLVVASVEPACGHLDLEIIHVAQVSYVTRGPEPFREHLWVRKLDVVHLFDAREPAEVVFVAGIVPFSVRLHHRDRVNGVVEVHLWICSVKVVVSDSFVSFRFNPVC
jgi:hypothetical protein